MKEVEWIEKRKQLADCMKKKVASSVELLEVLSTSKLQLIFKKRDATDAYTVYRSHGFMDI